MVKIDTLISGIVEDIKDDSYFADMKIINAYPNEIKPTRLSCVYIALGISEINIKPNQIDFSHKAGEVSVFADIYIPIRSNENMGEIFTQLCRVMNYYNLSSVRTYRMTADRDAEANVLKAVFTFVDCVDFGGDDGE